jgi:hypothetical protein
LNAFFISSAHATCPATPILYYVIILLTSYEQILIMLFHIPLVTSSHLGQNFLSVLCSQTPSIYVTKFIG